MQQELPPTPPNGQYAIPSGNHAEVIENASPEPVAIPLSPEQEAIRKFFERRKVAETPGEHVVVFPIEAELEDLRSAP